MFPNTFMMQEYIRRYIDESLDREEFHDTSEPPRVYTIPKGTLGSSNHHTTRF